MRNRFTAIIEKHDDWYVGYVEEIQGVNTQGKTLSEVRENLKDALKLIIETNRAIAEKGINSKDTIKEPITVEV
ncbi:MAG: type II toxin-antitoxin system HicB family antitoxin [Planctomycetota bacterium]|nr:type II toxin-antitoxin system HicB family antitoxin [Planctomycetota bacterium]